MATSPLVPGRLPVAIEDHAYQIEPSGFKRDTVEVLRQQADVSSEPGEASLNPQGLWRRSQESWHHGAGQDFLDGKTEQAADPHRFRSSKGVDIWTKGQVSLLHPTLNVWRTTASNLHLAVAGAFYLHVADGSEVYSNALPYGAGGRADRQSGSGWTATNATVSASSYYLNLTATAGAAVTATGSTGVGGIPVDGGRQYLVAIHTLYVSGGAARIPQVSVTWYSVSGSVINTTGPASAANTDAGGGQRLTTPMTAPAGAAFAAITVSWTTNWASGEIHSVLEANLIAYDLIAGNAPTQWVPVNVNAGQPAQTVQSLATNGTHVWAALGTSGLHRFAAGATSATADVPPAPAGGQIHLVGYANGFLLAAGSTTSTTGKNTLWRVDSPLTTPTLANVTTGGIKTHDNPSFEWTGIAPGRSCVYAFGNSGINGEVYKVTFDQNTGTLSTAASPASFLPDGETIHSLTFYAGGIIMGTGRGVRLGQADGAGNIDYGPLIETDWPVRCLEPQGRHCWFGWTKYDAEKSGLGRVDLGYFTDTLTPAWTSDLMTVDDSSGDTVACVTFAPFGYTLNQRPPVRVFTVAGEGVYIEDVGSRVLQGLLHTGMFRYATSEPKSMRAIDVRHHALPAGAAMYITLSRDDNPTLSLLFGPSYITDSYGATFGPTDAVAEAFELEILIERPDPAGTDYSRTPELTRWTTKALPQPSTIDETFTIPILMRREVLDNNDSNYAYPNGVAAEITYLKGLERSRALVTLQLGSEQHTVYLAQSRFEGQNWAPGKTHVEGVLHTLWQTVRG